MTNWSPERDAELRALWAQENPRLSCNDIAAVMRSTKNAIVGRAHRLHLPARPSPITADAQPWTDEQDARLRTLRDSGLTAREIGVQMGRGFDAVRNRIAKLQLPVVAQAARPRPRQNSAEALRVAKARTAPRPPFLAPALTKGSSPIPAAHASGDPGPAGFPGVTSNGGRVTGLSAPENSPPVPRAVPGAFSERGCRFPMWSNTERPDHRYCAAPVAQGAYCAHHAARCYDLSRPKGVGALPPTFGWRAA
jgi:GcrA cell cycle regulator